MSSLTQRGNKLYAKIKDVDGVWRRLATGFDVDQRAEAEAWVRDREREVRDELRRRRGESPFVLEATHPSIPDDCYDMETAQLPSTREGWLYALALIPEVTLGRIKIGWSSDVTERLRAHRTTNPTSTLIGLWDADRQHEDSVHFRIPGRIGTSEVFVVDPRDAFAVIRRVLERGT